MLKTHRWQIPVTGWDMGILHLATSRRARSSGRLVGGSIQERIKAFVQGRRIVGLCPVGACRTTVFVVVS
jgi:hypothetical protein